MSQLPLPPVDFQALVCGPADVHLFDEVGRWLVAFMRHEGLLPPGAALLDVGCGCGRVARHLVECPVRSYHGFDRHEGMVRWCRETIAAVAPRFEFDYVPLASLYGAWDDQPGLIAADQFSWGYPDASFDSALLASVFTHMPTAEVRHYLTELARVLRPGGQALFSIFFAEEGLQVRDHVNVFHDRRAFDADLLRLPCTVRSVRQRFVPGTPFHAQPSHDPVAGVYTHHWFHLTRAHQ